MVYSSREKLVSRRHHHRGGVLYGATLDFRTKNHWFPLSPTAFYLHHTMHETS